LNKNSVEIVPVPLEFRKKIHMREAGGTINTEKSTIHLYKDNLDNILNTPIPCHQCKNMKCINGGKMMEVQEREKAIWNKTRAEHCLLNALSILGGEVFHCIFCVGNP
jgi:hypothetical protein